MAAADIALADLIVAELNDSANEWSADFEAIRTWVIEWDNKETAELKVAVNPVVDPSIQPDERDGTQEEIWSVLIGFGQDLQERTRAEIDGLITVTDEVREHLQWADHTDTEGRLFAGVGSEVVLRFDPENIRRELVEGDVVYTGSFLSVVKINYRLCE